MGGLQALQLLECPEECSLDVRFVPAQLGDRIGVAGVGQSQSLFLFRLNPFVTDGRGRLTWVWATRPRKAAFDFAGTPSIDNGGDVAFRGRRAGEPCIPFEGQAFDVGCFSTVDVRSRASGVVERIAGSGDPAPGGGVFDFASLPRLNDRGEVAVCSASAVRPSDQEPRSSEGRSERIDF